MSIEPIIKIHNVNDTKVIEYQNFNIYVFENLISPELCDELIKFINTCSLDTCTLSTKRHIEKNNYVECYTITLDNLKKQQKYIEEVNFFDKKIFEIINKLIKIMNVLNPDIICNIDSGYELRKFYGKTELHVDGLDSSAGGYTNFIRSLTAITALNDNFTGGVFHFPAQNFSIKMKKGNVISFPPFWTHPHKVSSVKEGEARFTINTWILEKFS